MSDYFYSLQMLLSDYYTRAASGMRELELRDASALFALMEGEDNT